jgi:GT2 family glycosyltransferase
MTGSAPFSRLFTLVSLIADSWTRLRFRRAELRSLAPVRVTDDGSSTEATRWIASDAAPPASLLQSPVGSTVAYHLTLRDDARIVARCGALIGSGPDGQARRETVVEFTIHAAVAGREWTTSCRVTAAPSPAGPSFRPLSLSGPASIALTTRAIAAGTGGRVDALWENPRIEWRRPGRDVVRALHDVIRRRAPGAGRNALIAGERLYRLWVREHEPSKKTLEAQRATAASGTGRFTLITLVTDSSPSVAAGTRASVLAQSHPHWEWILLTAATDRRALDFDPRVRVIAAGAGTTPAPRLNLGLRAARGELAALLDDGDALAPHALFEMAQAIDRAGDADVWYSDEDRIAAGSRRTAPAFKPDWSPDVLLSCNYIGRFTMFRVAAMVAAGFRDGFGSAFEWELLLRLSHSGARFRRVPLCLYHRAEAAADPTPQERDLVLREHAEGLGLQFEIAGAVNASRVRWNVRGAPLVSVIIPNRNAAAVLQKCVDGLLHQTSYPRREIVIVDNGSTEAAVLELYAGLERGGHGQVVPFDRPFNFSAACNVGAAAATGELLLFLNNDIEVIEPEWMEELVRWAQRPGVGIVGAKLLYPDRMIQHAGVVFGLGLVGHIFGRAADGTTGVFGSTDWYRNYLAVTGACQMMRREVFDRLGGYDERLRLSFSDVILCMEAWNAGYRVVYTPWARLVHHESYTRQKEDSAEDMELFARYLRGANVAEDPYLHPQLDPRSLIPRVRSPFDPTPREVIADFIGQVLTASPLRS